MHQGVESECSVADPAVAIVPVAHATELFRKGRGWSGDNTAGGSVGQRFEGDKRAQDIRSPGPVIGTAGRPFLPPTFCVSNRIFGTIDGRCPLVGWMP